jgi:hypothetical protein
MIATRTSFTFALRKAARAVLSPFVALDAVVFAIRALQQDVSLAWTEVWQIAIVEAGVWVLVACLIYVQRLTNDRFGAMQDEIEDLKERMSVLETHDERDVRKRA